MFRYVHVHIVFLVCVSWPVTWELKFHHLIRTEPKKLVVWAAPPREAGWIKLWNIVRFFRCQWVETVFSKRPKGLHGFFGCMFSKLLALKMKKYFFPMESGQNTTCFDRIYHWKTWGCGTSQPNPSISFVDGPLASPSLNVFATFLGCLSLSWKSMFAQPFAHMAWQQALQLFGTSSDWVTQVNHPSFWQFQVTKHVNGRALLPKSLDVPNFPRLH